MARIYRPEDACQEKHRLRTGAESISTPTPTPRDSWVKRYDAEPAVWFHDIFRTDGTPFSTAEVQLIRNLSVGRNASRSFVEPQQKASRLSATSVPQ